MIRLVCYDPKLAWILGKFAVKTQENLEKMIVPSEIVPDFNPQGASVCHYICYVWHLIHLKRLFEADESILEPYYLHKDEDRYMAIGRFILAELRSRPRAKVETLMITHVDNEERYKLMHHLLDFYDMGVCMSPETRETLIATGLPADKLCYVSPGWDGVIKPRPIVLGIASRTYRDGRKRENRIIQAIQSFKPGIFSLKIMGSGWDAQVKCLQEQGHVVKYYKNFNYDIYTNSFIPSLDYLIYFSHDEGSMSYLDALAADVKTIVTGQGFHLDIQDGINHIISDANDLKGVLQKIYSEQQARINRVSGWTWAEHAWRHLVIWDYLLNRSDKSVLAEENVLFKLLPKIAGKIGDVLVYELLVNKSLDYEPLAHAAAVAEGEGLQSISQQLFKQALVYNPKITELREKVLEQYPAYKAML